MEYFETIKCEDKEVFNLHFHNLRLASTIGKNIDLNEYIYPLNSKLLKCKVIYNDDEIIDVRYDEYKKREIKSFKIVYDDNIEYSKKYLNRASLDELYAKKEDAHEIIIFKNYLLTDTSIANIALYDGSNWYTPKKPLLNGTTRQRYLESKNIIEKDLTIEDLKSASKLALMNAMIDFDIIKNPIFIY
ncbi:aminotransferase class IV family protein [Arcobacter sp. KX21116]|uniref:aminotransferase class IV family protein n=1 Tax=Arcobacter iocasae TaxID=2906515 RepID=UPI0035D42061